MMRLSSFQVKIISFCDACLETSLYMSYASKYAYVNILIIQLKMIQKLNNLINSTRS